MFIKQFYLGCLSHASYMIGDENAGVAAVIDPQRDIEQYVAEAKEQGVKITHIFLTHFHADFVAGHLELQEETGAAIYLGQKAQAEYECVPVSDGTKIQLGQVHLQILETPGHTPEGISILVFDDPVSAESPYAVLTGDTLFIGDVGRPDLAASLGISAAELASQLYESLHEKLMKLPNETLLYPAHGAGSLCGKSLSDSRSSTIGEQKRFNYALKAMDKAAFIQLMTAELPAAPPYFFYDAQLNRQQRGTLPQAVEAGLKLLSLASVLELKHAGAQIVDVRNSAAYAQLHLSDSLNIGLSGKFATWAGTVLNKDQPIVIIAAPGSEKEAVVRLGRIGFDNVAGFLEKPDEALAANPNICRRTNRVSATELSQQIAQHAPVVILDVRSAAEAAAGKIPNSLNIPLPELNGRLDELPHDTDILVHCASGYRSSLASGILEQNGFDKHSDLVGGFTAWDGCRSK